MAQHKIVLIPGDGIGPEVTAATKRVIDAAGLQRRVDRVAGWGKRAGAGV